MRFRHDKEVVLAATYTGHLDPGTSRRVPWKKRIVTAKQAAELIPAG
ncbi:hypothetical protein [Bacillus thuringiensis]|nr:hypothetical protein [Bacillus thuringiensis]